MKIFEQHKIVEAWNQGKELARKKISEQEVTLPFIDEAPTVNGSMQRTLNMVKDRANNIGITPTPDCLKR